MSVEIEQNACLNAESFIESNSHFAKLRMLANAAIHYALSMAGESVDPNKKVTFRVNFVDDEHGNATDITITKHSLELVNDEIVEETTVTSSDEYSQKMLKDMKDSIMSLKDVHCSLDFKVNSNGCVHSAELYYTGFQEVDGEPQEVTLSTAYTECARAIAASVAAGHPVKIG